jgi:hypothetical protein
MRVFLFTLQDSAYPCLQKHPRDLFTSILGLENPFMNHKGTFEYSCGLNVAFCFFY